MHQIEWENMGRISQVKSDERYSSGRFSARVRLNLNDLLKKRQEEKRFEKKTNLQIFSGATAVAAVVFVILIL